MRLKRFLKNLLFIVLAVLEISLFSFVLFKIVSLKTDKLKYIYFFVLVLVFYVYRIGKGFIKLYKSRTYQDIVLNYSRTMGVCGPQGSGKTSLACYFATNKRFKDVYSNVPIKVNNKFTYKIKEQHMDLKYKFNEYSLQIFDEISLYFDNLQNVKRGSREEKLGIYQQFIRHFIDGNFICTSVNISRIPKFIREKLSIVINTLNQSGYNMLLLNFIYKRFFKIDYSLRIWDTLILRDLQQTQDTYNFDLSNVNDKINIANLYTFVCCNWLTSFDYDDRYFKPLYKGRYSNTYFNNIKLSKSNLKDFGVEELNKKINGVDKK